MRLKRLHILLAFLLLAILAMPFRAKLRRPVVAAIQILKGKKTIEDRVEQYGNVARERLSPYFAEAKIAYPPKKLVFVGLKQEKLLEIWASHDRHAFTHIRTYPILGTSGILGPKLEEGDMQVPEGIYRVESLNPNSMFHLSLRLDYPNESDRKHAKEDGRQNLGSDIMIHGNTCSIGCLAMGDEAAEDLFVLAAETGIDNISVILSPVDFRKHDMPATKSSLPVWTNEVYASIQTALAVLGVAPNSDTVRVAAIQCYSRMGKIEYNRRLLTGLITEAAESGAKIIVLPECAVTGYMDPGYGVIWTSKEDARDGEMSVAKSAETIPGPSTKHFGDLARRLGIYLSISLAEKDKGDFFNSQVLLDPEGRIAAHHRKRSLWTPGDGLWVSEGNRPVQAIDTPYGRLGLMICYDVHSLPKLLAQKNVDIVLYSVGWFGPNTENWYRNIFPRKYVVPNRFSTIVANWSADEDSPGWPGHGHSCIIGSDGNVLIMAKSDRGTEVVLADLPITVSGIADPTK